MFVTNAKIIRWNSHDHHTIARSVTVQITFDSSLQTIEYALQPQPNGVFQDNIDLPNGLYSVRFRINNDGWFVNRSMYTSIENGNTYNQILISDVDSSDDESSDASNALEEQMRVGHNRLYYYNPYHSSSDKMGMDDRSSDYGSFQSLGSGIYQNEQSDSDYEDDEKLDDEEDQTFGAQDDREDDEFTGFSIPAIPMPMYINNDTQLFYALNNMLSFSPQQQYSKWDVDESNAGDRYYFQYVLPLCIELLTETYYVLTMYMISNVICRNFYYVAWKFGQVGIDRFQYLILFFYLLECMESELGASIDGINYKRVFMLVFVAIMFVFITRN